MGITTAAAQDADPGSAIGGDLGGYGVMVGLDTRFGDVAGGFGAFVGGHAAVLLKRRVYVGLGGYGLATDRQPFDMGYGGLLVGYVIPTSGLVQFTAETLLAGGAVKPETLAGVGGADWQEVLVFEPAIGAEIRLARVVRLGFGTSYRFVGGLDLPGFTDRDVRGVVGSAAMRVGWF